MRRTSSPLALASRALLIILLSCAVPSAAFAPSAVKWPTNGNHRSPAVSVFASSGRLVSKARRNDWPQAPHSSPRWCFQSRLPLRPGSLPSTALPDEESSSVVGEAEAEAAAAAPATSDGNGEGRSLLQRIRTYFAPKKDDVPFRQRLAKMGLAAVLSYGWVSNMSYTVTVSLAWYIFSKQTGMSPLAPGQWKGFLAVYAGFWVFNNVVRPIRLAVSVAISPQFDKVVLGIQDRLKVSKATAITITVVVANLIGTTFFMGVGIFAASILAGVPIFPR